MRYETETMSYALYLGANGAWHVREASEGGDLVTAWYDGRDEMADFVDSAQSALRETGAPAGIEVGFCEIPGVGTGFFLVAAQTGSDSDEPATDPAWDTKLQAAATALALTTFRPASWIDAPIEL
ncbi:hypothetical protein [Kitasatospora sp. NPDC058046]|uniref:hypothetical protein n=1 Tax=Kitasatospora sp. NPDC058046 TaxID=3346312 RepID=UPI0036D78B27